MTKKTNKISAVIITKNEEHNIERCLKSLHWVDEVVVVDSGSTDRTLEICRKYNCKIIETEWLGYGITKQLSVNTAHHDWVLSIDADEQVTPESVDVIKSVLESPKHHAYKIKIKSFYLGKAIKHSSWGNEFKLRIFNKKFGNYNDNEIHESIIIEGETSQIKAEFNHYSYPTISSHVNKMDRYTDLQAVELKRKGKQYSLFTTVLLSMNKFISMYFFHLGFLDGKEGFILCSNSAYGVYLKYLKLRELNVK